MRISDWSSDVCSSDLARPERRRRFMALHGQVFVLGYADAVQKGEITARRGGEPGNIVGPLVAEAAAGGQIGRASCWGTRVSDRGELGGGRIIKQKKNTKKKEYRTHLTIKIKKN